MLGEDVKSRDLQIYCFFAVFYGQTGGYYLSLLCALVPLCPCASVVKSRCLGLTTKEQRHKEKFSAVQYQHNSAKCLSIF